MRGINPRRVLLGGLAAGAVSIVVEVFVEIVLLGGVLGFGTESERGAAIGYSRQGWVVWNHLINLLFPFLMGTLLVATYAAVQPRFGPGLKSVLAASGIILGYWTLVLVYVTNYQILTLAQSGASFVDNLIVVPVATWAGARVYRGRSRVPPP